MNPIATYFVRPDLAVLQQDEPVPGQGILSVNAFLLLGPRPVLVDTGAARERAAFLTALETLVDPADLAWIVLTHPDADHMGALPELLQRAPKARLVVNAISTGKLRATLLPPLARLQWANPGDRLVAGDRVLHFLQPPMYDCPSTLTFYESKGGALFTSDAFGAFTPAPARAFEDLPREASLEGMSAFCRANSPWLADVRPEPYAQALQAYASLEPRILLGSHLPPVGAASVAGVLARAARFPSEGRVAQPGQQVLQAALEALGKAA